MDISVTIFVTANKYQTRYIGNESLREDRASVYFDYCFYTRRVYKTAYNSFGVPSMSLTIAQSVEDNGSTTSRFLHHLEIGYAVHPTLYPPRIFHRGFIFAS
jgi:hypothetical protein